MLKALMRVRLAAIGNWLSGGGRGTRGGKVGYAVLMGFVAVMLAFMMFTWFRMIAEPFHAAGVGFLYFIFFNQKNIFTIGHNHFIFF